MSRFARGRRTGALAAAVTPLVLAILAIGAPSAAQAQVACPNPVPVVNENNCQGPGTSAWRISSAAGWVQAFSDEPSVNLGQPVHLKIGRSGAGSVAVRIYRIGYYGGTGGRLVHTATGVSVTNPVGCTQPDSTFGRSECSSWSVSYTIPGSALPASGVYIAKITDDATGGETQAVFVVRDDARSAPVLFKLPTSTYQAYNSFGGKSFYDFNSEGFTTVAGTDRAAKVSFDRPYGNIATQDNWFPKVDYALVYWLEKQGYDAAYTESTAVHAAPAELLDHQTLVISGHDEYWSLEEMQGYLNARNAGVNVASFSSNTGYWKVRYEDSGATMVGHKTVQGSGSSGSGSAGSNDWGPDKALGTADDALGLDGQAGTADDRPQNSTTTFRDNGAAPGDPNAPSGGRVGPDMPENALFGSMYVGDNDSKNYGLTVPPGNAGGEYAADRVWRNTGVSPSSGATITNNIVGWEWDAVPSQAQYLAQQPAGVKRLSATNVNDGSGWVQDEGRVYNTSPPPGQPGVVGAVKYRHSSGALVFSTGTNQWSWGLGPHWREQQHPSQTFQDPPLDSTDARIGQATYNVLADMGLQPGTPTGIVLDGGNQPPEASFSVSPNPALTGQAVSFDGSGSSDPDGSVARYEWDLDGNGSFETDTGTSPTATRTYTAAGNVQVKLRVTDSGGLTAETARTLVVSEPGGGSSPYSDAIQATQGLLSYWRLGELTGTTLADSRGGNHATLNGAALGAPGALAGDSNTSVSFDGQNDFASAPLNLSGTSRATVEFWLKWDAYADNDNLALELTPNFNQAPGGLLADPNAPQDGGRFGVGIGSGLSRNNAFFQRPSAGAWHHYALVFDANAAPTAQITPYVDGAPVPYTKTASGTGAGNFANSVLYFMSRAGSSLFGAGDLDELAVYGDALSPTTIASHYGLGSAGTSNQPPSASFTVSPNPAAIGQQVSFNGAGSSDPDGQVARYEWDLDGNGSFETDTGTTSTASRSYASAQTLSVGLRVTDNSGTTNATTRSLSVTGANQGPTASFTASPNPALTDQQVSFNGAASSDPDGQVARYEWDLDGNGSFETDTGTTSTASRSYASAQTLSVGLRVTDNGGASATTTRPLTVSAPSGGTSAYAQEILGTAGLVSYWRLGEQSGNTLADIKAGRHATVSGATLGAPGALAGDTNASVSFDGTDDTASAPLDLSGASRATVEFWLKWDAFAGNDDLALEHTPNFNQNPGGILVDPNAPEDGGRFGVGIGNGSSRNNAYFNRPSAGAWHHYAFVLDTGAPAATQITPYVDGQAVPYTKLASGTGAGNFANSVLYFMSRGGAGLFGAGDLDELAVYADALGAGAIASHYQTGSTAGPQGNQPPTASFTATPNPAVTGQQVSFNGAASSDPDGQVARYEWDLDGNGSFETDTGTTSTASRSYASAQTLSVGLRVTDTGGASATTTRSVTVQAAANQSPTASFTITPAAAATRATVSFNGAASSDPDGQIAKYEWDLDGNGSFETDTGTTASATRVYSSVGAVNASLRVTDNAGAAATASGSLSVASAYAQNVLGTAGLRGYWRLADSGTSAADASSSANPGTYRNGPVSTGALISGEQNAARGLDGVNDWIDLAAGPFGAPAQVSAEAWVRTGSTKAAGGYHFLITNSSSDFNNGFSLAIDQANRATFVAARNPVTGVVRGQATSSMTLTPNSTNHVVGTYDRSRVRVYVNGVESGSAAFTGAIGWNGLRDLRLGRKVASSAAAASYLDGSLDEAAVYTAALPAATVLAHYDAGKP